MLKIHRWFLSGTFHSTYWLKKGRMEHICILRNIFSLCSTVRWQKLPKFGRANTSVKFLTERLKFLYQSRDATMQVAYSKTEKLINLNCTTVSSLAQKVTKSDLHPFSSLDILNAKVFLSIKNAVQKYDIVSFSKNRNFHFHKLKEKGRRPSYTAAKTFRSCNFISRNRDSALIMSLVFRSHTSLL